MGDKRTVKYNKSAHTILTEKNLLAKMDSKFVTGLAYSFKDASNLYMVLDLKEGGDLKFHLNKEVLFSEERARFYAAQTLLGLEHIHSHGIIYRDMKLENVLLDKHGNCSLSDLGLAVLAQKVRKGYAGTPGYTAPEMVAQHPYDKRVDFFSFGVMVFRFLSGKKPFDVRHRDKTKKKVRKQQLLDQSVLKRHPEFQDKYFSPRAKDLLTHLLRKDPNKRLGKNGIDTIKKHPWFYEIDFVLLSTGSVQPPMKPDINEVKTDSANQSTRQRKEDKFKNVKLTPEFDEELKGFPSVSRGYVQHELVEILKRRAELSEELPQTPDETQFEVGDEVLFRGQKNRKELKEGVVTSVRPLKVKGKTHWFARRYSYVIHKKDKRESEQENNTRKKEPKQETSTPEKQEALPPVSSEASAPNSSKNFSVGEHVYYRNKNGDLKEGIITQLNPLKVRGKNHWFSRKYQYVVKKSEANEPATNTHHGEETIE